MMRKFFIFIILSYCVDLYGANLIWEQSDWSGGPGQRYWYDVTRYWRGEGIDTSLENGLVPQYRRGIRVINNKDPFTLPGEEDTIWVYYGDPRAESKSNGDSTFDFFDDFEDGVWTNKWDVRVVNDIIEIGGYLRLTGYNASWEQKITVQSTGNPPENTDSALSIVIAKDSLEPYRFGYCISWETKRPDLYIEGTGVFLFADDSVEWGYDRVEGYWLGNTDNIKYWSSYRPHLVDGYRIATGNCLLTPYVTGSAVPGQATDSGCYHGVRFWCWVDTSLDPDVSSWAEIGDSVQYATYENAWFNDDIWYHYKVTFYKDTFKIYQDNNLLIGPIRDTVWRNKRFGICSMDDDAYGYFDNFIIRKFVQPEPLTQILP